jgi:O-antigen ligase
MSPVRLRISWNAWRGRQRIERGRGCAQARGRRSYLTSITRDRFGTSKWFLDLTAWTAALAISGYPVAALISTFAGVSDDSISVIFRLLVFGLAAVAFWRNASRVPLVALDGWLTLFWLIYAGRLLWDWTEPSVVGADIAIQIFIASVMIPTLAVGVSARNWNDRNSAWCFLAVGTLVCAGGLWLNASGSAADAALYETTGRLSFDKVNPISLGHVACTTMLATLVLGTDSRWKFFRGLIVVACAGVALWMLYLAASRGPVVSLVCCLAAYVVARGAWAHTLAIAVVIYIAVGTLEVVDVSSLLETLRLTEVGTDASSLERHEEINQALAEFEKHPWLGSSYALPSGDYPHNIFVEAAMALGVPGLALLAIISLRSLSASLWALNAGYRFAALLLVQFLVAGQFSGTLYGWPGLWIGIAVLMTLRRNELHKYGRPGAAPGSLAPAIGFKVVPR